jgi:hypothetical protein
VSARLAPGLGQERPKRPGAQTPLLRPRFCGCPPPLGCGNPLRLGALQGAFPLFPVARIPLHQDRGPRHGSAISDFRASGSHFEGGSCNPISRRGAKQPGPVLSSWEGQVGMLTECCSSYQNPSLGGESSILEMRIRHSRVHRISYLEDANGTKK